MLHSFLGGLSSYPVVLVVQVAPHRAWASSVGGRRGRSRGRFEGVFEAQGAVKPRAVVVRHVLARQPEAPASLCHRYEVKP